MNSGLPEPSAKECKSHCVRTPVRLMPTSADRPTTVSLGGRNETCETGPKREAKFGHPPPIPSPIGEDGFLPMVWSWGVLVCGVWREVGGYVWARLGVRGRPPVKPNEGPEARGWGSQGGGGGGGELRVLHPFVNSTHLAVKEAVTPHRGLPQKSFPAPKSPLSHTHRPHHFGFHRGPPSPSRPPQCRVPHTNGPRGPGLTPQAASQKRFSMCFCKQLVRQRD